MKGGLPAAQSKHRVVVAAHSKKSAHSTVPRGAASVALETAVASQSTPVLRGCSARNRPSPQGRVEHVLIRVPNHPSDQRSGGLRWCVVGPLGPSGRLLDARPPPSERRAGNGPCARAENTWSRAAQGRRIPGWLAASRSTSLRPAERPLHGRLHRHGHGHRGAAGSRRGRWCWCRCWCGRWCWRWRCWRWRRRSRWERGRMFSLAWAHVHSAHTSPAHPGPTALFLPIA